MRLLTPSEVKGLKSWFKPFKGSNNDANQEVLDILLLLVDFVNVGVTVQVGGYYRRCDGIDVWLYALCVVVHLQV